MKSPFILLGFLFTVNSLLAQSIDFKGALYDDLSKEPVLYAKIGVVGSKVGTICGKDGSFSLSIPDSLSNGELRISVYGYETLSITVSELFKLNKTGDLCNIFLTQEPKVLDEISIVSERLKEKFIGNKSESGRLTIGFPSNVLGAEIGVKLKVKKRSFINSFTFFMSENDYDSLVLRLNFYSYSKKKKGIDFLVVESVIFHLSNKNSGVINLDLSNYFLTIDEDIFLALEIVDGLSNNDNNKISFGAEIGKGSYARYTSQSEWDTLPMVVPGFGLIVRQ